MAARFAASRVARAATSRSAVANFSRANRRLMRTEAEEYQALGGPQAFFGTAMEQPKGSYQNEVRLRIHFRSRAYRLD